MTAGLSQVNLAHAWLNVLRGTTFTGAAGTFIQVHIGDPGSAGTANPSAVTTRQSVTLAAPSGGAVVSSTAPAFTMTATETITHISVHSASTSGTFYWSAALTTPKAVVNTDTLTFTAGGVGISLAPIAA
jgi:hypothetical protein